MCAQFLHLDVSQNNDIAVVRIKDKSIDAISTQEVADELFSLVKEHGVNKIVLNLGNVEFLQSMALGRFVALKELTSGANGELRLCNLRPTVAELFEITGLTEVLDIRHDQDAALEGL
ncbi:MAG: anti-sigma factor antagonist [Planctomycetes bacterium]|nr:anti-sigma factor antagonist [Planctomycetota bacterium]